MLYQITGGKNKVNQTPPQPNLKLSFESFTISFYFDPSIFKNLKVNGCVSEESIWTFRVINESDVYCFSPR